MPKPTYYETLEYPRTLIIGVITPTNRNLDQDAYIDEFKHLVKTNGIIYKDEMLIKLRDIDHSYFFTSGKLDLILDEVEKNNIEQVIISETLTAQQERNITDYLGCTVIDRTRLILEIFEKAAYSAEGKAQVAIAKFQHEKTRLAGKGIHLAQQSGVRGVRGGPGETLKERERRVIDIGIHRFKKQLETIAKSRETQRKRRLDRGIPHICLIGYTNAGKSTILNALTKSDVLAEDKLFATLDTTTRELYVDGEKKGVISDTVGFIQNLPPHLIEAFKSTLSELQYADLLLHVVDLSDKNWQQHVKVVEEILADLEVDIPVLYVFNKADLVYLDDMPNIGLYEPQVIVSARSREELAPLLDYLKSWQPS